MSIRTKLAILVAIFALGVTMSCATACYSLPCGVGEPCTAGNLDRSMTAGIGVGLIVLALGIALVLMAFDEGES